MSEKRFTSYYERGNEVVIEDNGKRLSNKKVVDLLNEQQATIKQLESDKAIAEDYANIFEMENVKLRKKCGESDGENAKLRIENKELQEEIKLLKPANIEQYEQIIQLQEENEQLRKELGDCEKFRYTVFKRLNDEHIKECSIR